MSGKNVLLGVSGGIAAYKAVEIVSRLKKKHFQVQVIMTENAAKFIAPLTFREISGNQVTVSMWTEAPKHNVEHIALAEWADILLVAPATANIIAKMAAGIADDMLTTTALALKAPIMICPAMNTNMYEHPLTQENLRKLKTLGIRIIPPAAGLLACGAEGLGRLPEPADIVAALEGYFQEESLAGLKVLVTAGGTIEAIDPVRYIGNRSSGRMGYAIAQEAALRGARVVLISAPTALPQPYGVQTRQVESAQAMREAVLAEYEDADIVIKAAAVADYRVKNVSDQKIKKQTQNLVVELVPNPDILKELGRRKTRQYLVGFAAETENVLDNARKKLAEKNLDMIVANDVSLPGAGFNHDTNIVKFIYPSGTVISLDKLTKQEVAVKLFDHICASLNKTVAL